MREKEKLACMNNNIGIGNTFVWASKNSNTNDYTSMVEDTENPENNVCFVRVELKSLDSKISVSDIPPVYFEMGRTIKCGAWADSGMIKNRILDARKNARTWGTVAGVVGGAGVGVGAMELFGNRLIGGAVQGQKSLQGAALAKSQLSALEKRNPGEHQKLTRLVEQLRDACGTDVWTPANLPKPPECDEYSDVISAI